MIKSSKTNTGYRYPGSRPFYDSETDRCLFFGREQEKNSFLYTVLTNRLAVLYAKAGLGKTSFINAGLNQELRDRGFIPLMIRLNNPGIDPIQGIYKGIKKIVKQEHLDYEEGEENTLWQHFKTIAFWAPGNKLQKPVLILDQFEEFFKVYLPETRLSFAKQFADLVNNNIPDEVYNAIRPGEPFPYSNRPPNVKIIISIREDYLGYLDEMADYIPGILDNRYRLLPLSIKQARQAIVEPSRVNNELIKAKSFAFTPEAVDMMLDYLCSPGQADKIKNKDQIESLNLQLMCRHIEENTVPEKVKIGGSDIIIEVEDLGGEYSMHQLMKRSYDGLMENFKLEENRELNFEEKV